MSVNYDGNMTPRTQTQVGDPITQLPVDQEPLNSSEVEIVNTLFKENRSTLDKIVGDSKDALFVGVLVILFSLPQVDLLINKLVPSTAKSPYITVLVKGLIAVAMFWIIKYFYLSRAKN